MIKQLLPSFSKTKWGLFFIYIIPFVPIVYKLISPFFIIAGLGAYTVIINPAIFIIGMLMSSRIVFSSIRSIDIALYVSIGFMILLWTFFRPQTYVFFKDNYMDFMMYVLPCYFIGLTINYERDHEILLWLARMSFIVVLFWQICLLLRLVEVSEGADGGLGEQMEQAYMLVYPICFLFNESMKKHKLIDIIMTIISIILLLMMGTRGPFIVICIYLAVYLVFLKEYKKYKLFWRSLVIGLLFILLKYSTVISLAMIPISTELGFSSRVFQNIVDSGYNLDDSSGRDDIYGPTLNAIQSNEGILGYGWGGDRNLNNMGFWAHNFELEILAQFGILVGGLILLLVIGVFYKSCVKSKGTYYFQFIIVMFFIGLMCIQLSSTYIKWPLFFVFLGVCVSTLRQGPSASKNRVNYKSNII